MKKLDDIPKTSVFKVPEGYFDQLPVKIQSRMTERPHASATNAWTLSLKYALPVVVLVIAGIFWLRPAPTLEDQLEEIDADQIALYLEATDRVETNDVYETMDWTAPELRELEDSVYSNMEYDLLEEFDLDNL
jgi:hypothetical protein